MSTTLFGEYAKFVRGKLHTCDISLKTLKMLSFLPRNSQNLSDTIIKIV